MKETLKLALVQQRASADIEANIQRGEAALIKAAQAGADVVAFSELAFTPFYPQHRAASPPLHLAEFIDGPTVTRFRALAAEYRIVTVLNLYEREGDHAYDSSPVIDSDGTLLGAVRMAHIMEGPGYYERDYYTPGNGPLVFDTSACRIGVAICYDRHYPEYMRRLALEGAELVIIPQAGAAGEWPDGLYEAEVKVAAFQNGYFAGLANRVGQEEVLNFAGSSFAVDPHGQMLGQLTAEEESILYVTLDSDRLQDCASRKHFSPDRRPELYDRWKETNGL